MFTNYYVFLTDFYCNICVIELPFKSKYNRHITTRQHQQLAQAWLPTEADVTVEESFHDNDDYVDSENFGTGPTLKYSS